MLACGTINAIAPPIGVDAALSAIADYGASDRLGATALFRSGLAQQAGGGRFREIALLGGATWRHRAPSWDLGVELRGGALRVNGIGFAVNDASWVKWWEVGAFVGWRIGRTTIGLELAATTLRDHAVTRDRLVSQNIPLARLGVSATFDIVSK